MIPTPIALGLTLCEKVLVEEGNRNVTLVGCFSKLGFEQFPSPPTSFFAFAALTNGQGDATVKLVITQLKRMKSSVSSKVMRISQNGFDRCVFASRSARCHSPLRDAISSCCWSTRNGSPSAIGDHPKGVIHE